VIQYEIMSVDLVLNEMQVKYSEEGKDDYFLWIGFGEHPNVDEDYLHAEAKKGAQEASAQWKDYEERKKLSEDFTLNTNTGVAKPWVFEDPPEYNELVYEIEAVITEEEEVMRRGWRLIELTDDQRSSAVRIRRSALLKETGIQCLTDRTPTEELIAYRQALRDVPQQEGFPRSVTWPIAPSNG